MYRVLLVDDEALELDALKNYVDWKAMGMELAGTARNGKDAWEKILIKEPDVVITDIQMPVMDGITLADKIFHLNRQIRIIFLTGYDEVEYLKAAIKVSAVDYILKPFSDESIRSAMEKVCEEMEKDSLIQNSVKESRSALIRKICVSEKPQKEQLERLRQLSEFEQDSDYYGMMQFYGISMKRFAFSLENKLSEIVSVWQEERRLTVVVKGYVNIADSSRRISDLLFRLTDIVYNGVYYEDRISGNDLREVFRVLESYEERMFYQPQQALLRVDRQMDIWQQGSKEELDRELTDQIRKRLTESIMAGRQKEVEDVTEQLFNSFLSSRIVRTMVIRCLDKLLYQVERVCMVKRSRDQMRRLLCETMSKAESSINVDQIREAVLKYLRAMAACNAADASDTTEYVAQKVKEYIHKNYAMQFTSADLAREIHLSQNYIRSIFKESTGKTVLEYLTEYRFEKAANLLRMAGAKVKDVSVAVGYENVPYFCTLFTKIYGMTPGEYHKKYKN